MIFVLFTGFLKLRIKVILWLKCIWDMPMNWVEGCPRMQLRQPIGIKRQAKPVIGEPRNALISLKKHNHPPLFRRLITILLKHNVSSIQSEVPFGGKNKNYVSDPFGYPLALQLFSTAKSSQNPNVPIRKETGGSRYAINLWS